MKYSCFFLLPFFALSTIAQVPQTKLPKDSITYYRKELNDLWKNTFDSLKNSEKYKELYSKLYPNQKKNGKIVRVELLAYAGLYFTDFKNLNARLKMLGEEEIKSLVPSVGASLAVGLPIMTYGIELSSYVFDNKSASFRGAHFRFYIGTNIFKKGPIVLHPQLGYSASILNLYIHGQTSSTNFNDLFTTQANTVQLSNLNNYLDFALGLKLKGSTENFYWQFLRVGYRYGLKEQQWSMRDGDIADAPYDRNNQFYIQFCLGFDRD
jgi:hypothetical protein